MKQNLYSESDFLNNFSFEKLVAPYTSDEFFEEFFEKKPLVIKRQNHDYYGGLLSASDLDQILFHWPHDVSVENFHHGSGAKTRMPFGARQPQVQSVIRELDEGKNIIFENLDQRHPHLSRLCALLEKEHTWRYQANVHMTPPIAHNSKIQNYGYNALFLQVSGARSWRVNRVVSAERSEERSTDEPEIDLDHHDTFVLEPGDLVYVPKGFAHSAAADAFSICVELRPHPPSWLEVITFIVNQCASSRVELSLSVPPGFTDQIAGEVAEAVKRHLLELSQLELIDESRALIRARSGFYRGLFYGALEHRLQKPALDRSATYVRNVYLKSYVEIMDDIYRVQTPQKQVDLPIIFKQSLDFCLSGDAFEISNIPGMEPQERDILLERLLAEGIVIRAG